MKSAKPIILISMFAVVIFLAGFFIIQQTIFISSFSISSPSQAECKTRINNCVLKRDVACSEANQNVKYTCGSCVADVFRAGWWKATCKYEYTQPDDPDDPDDPAYTKTACYSGTGSLSVDFPYYYPTRDVYQFTEDNQHARKLTDCGTKQCYQESRRTATCVTKESCSGKSETWQCIGDLNIKQGYDNCGIPVNEDTIRCDYECKDGECISPPPAVVCCEVSAISPSAEPSYVYLDSNKCVVSNLERGIRREIVDDSFCGIIPEPTPDPSLDICCAIEDVYTTMQPVECEFGTVVDDSFCSSSEDGCPDKESEIEICSDGSEQVTGFCDGNFWMTIAPDCPDIIGCAEDKECPKDYFCSNEGICTWVEPPTPPIDIINKNRVIFGIGATVLIILLGVYILLLVKKPKRGRKR